MCHKGFILAAGKGKRLYPLTLEIPKPLLPVGKIPIITYLIKLYLKYGLNEIKINVQKKHLEDFSKWKATYFPSQKIEFIVEEKPSGTFTPIAKKLNPKWFSETLVVSNGDELKDLNLKKMIEFHRRKKALLTIGLIKVKNPQGYGTVKIKGDKIREFAEKSKNPLSLYINSGIYIMEPEIRKYFPKRKKIAMLETDLFPKLAREGKLFGYKWKGKWFDCGNWQRYSEAIHSWKKNKPLRTW